MRSTLSCVIYIQCPRGLIVTLFPATGGRNDDVPTIDSGLGTGQVVVGLPGEHQGLET